MQTPSWPTAEQLALAKPIVPIVPKVQGRREFLPRLDEKTHFFIVPCKRIHNQSLMETWMASEAYVRLIDFLQSLNESVFNVSVSDGQTKPRSRIVLEILTMFDTMDSWIEEIPLDTSSVSRFGNVAFRIWIEKLNQKASSLHLLILEQIDHPAMPELVPYLTGGFGDGTRMDYGSGHELSFVAWLCCIDLLGLIKKEDYCVVVLVIFTRYLSMVRKLQKTYNLEPAGSHGVWGLDDYQFLPYFFGSAQLKDHPKIKPKSIANGEIVSYFAKEYLYLACIEFIHQNKKGPFHEHSPILYDISGVAQWSKVNTGMLKMYIAEVLMKFPVVQHFLFGSLLPFSPMLELKNNINWTGLQPPI